MIDWFAILKHIPWLVGVALFLAHWSFLAYFSALGQASIFSQGIKSDFIRALACVLIASSLILFSQSLIESLVWFVFLGLFGYLTWQTRPKLSED